MKNSLPKRTLAMMVAAIMTFACAAGSVVAGVVVSNAAHMSGDGSTYNNYVMKRVGWDGSTATSLINTDGTVNYVTLSQLVYELGKAGTGHTGHNESNDLGYTEWHAGDFSNAVVASSDSQSGGIFVKLFPTITQTDNGVNGYLQGLTSTWYQVVYRSQANGEDVLTLYAAQPYRTSVFAQNEEGTLGDDRGATYKSSSYHGETYTFESNYSTSIVRHNVLSDFNKLIINPQFNKADISNYFVSASDLPVNWQTSAFQTGTNQVGDYYDNNNAGGASGYGYDELVNENFYSLTNGMDDTGTAHSAWTSSIEDCSTDKMWLPSAFETVYTGKGIDAEDVFESYIDEQSDTLLRTMDAERIQAWKRHGLWRLNGFDRAFSENYALGENTVDYSWLRSACSNDEFQSHARSISSIGGGIGNYVDGATGVRPALHLNLTEILNPEIEPIDDKDKQDLYFYKETIARILDGRITDYKIVAGMTEILVSMEAAYASLDIEQTAIDALVAQAKTLIQINDVKFKEAWGIITKLVNEQQVEFTQESWTLYQAALANVESLLTEIDGLNAQVATIAGLNAQITSLTEQLSQVTADRDTYYTNWQNTLTTLNSWLGRIDDALEDVGLLIPEGDLEEIEDLVAIISGLLVQIAELESDNEDFRIANGALVGQCNALSRQLGELQEEFDAMVLAKNAKIAELEGEISDLEDQVSTLEADLLAAQIARDKYKSDWEAALADMDTFLGEIDDLLAEIGLITGTEDLELDDLTTLVTSLKSQITALTTANAELNGRIADLEQDIEDLQDELTALETELADTIAAKDLIIGGLQDQITALQGEKTALEGQKTALEDELVTVKEQRDTYKTNYDNALIQIATLESEIDDLEEQIKALEEDNEQIPVLEARIAELEIQLGEAQTSNTTNYNNWQAALVTISEKDTAIEGLNTQITNKNTEITGLNSQITQLNQDKQDLADEVERLENTISGLQSQLSTLTGENTELNELVAEMQNTIDDLETELEDLGTELADTIAAKDLIIGGLQEQITTLQGEKTALETQIETLEGEIADLNEQIEALEEDNEQIPVLEARITELETELGEAQTELADKNTQIDGLNAQITQLNQDKQDLADEITALETQIADLLAQLDANGDENWQKWQEALTTISEKEDEITGLKSQVSDKETQLTTANEEKQQLETQLGDITEQFDELTDEFTQAKTERDTYYDNWQSAETQITAHEDYIGDLNELIDDLTGQLVDIEELNDEITRLNEAIQVLLDAQEGLTEQSNKGLDPLWIGLIAAAGMLFAGSFVVFSLSGRGRKRSPKTADSNNVE